MSEGDSNGSRKGAGSALLIVVALYPEVTCLLLEIKLMCHYYIIRINCSCKVDSNLSIVLILKIPDLGMNLEGL